MRRLTSPDWLSRRTAAAITALYAVWAALLLSNFDLHPLAAEKFGLVFNDVAHRLPHWDFTVSPTLIMWEAFLRDGKTYTYFGILPGIARIPLVLLGGESVDVARISCLAAVTMVVWFAVRTVQFACAMPGSLTPVAHATPNARTTPNGRAHWFAAPAMVGMLLTGPPIYVLSSASIYHEAIFWAAAFTVAFNAIVLRRWFTGGRLSSRDFLFLALTGGLCLLTRASCGMALYAALFLLMLARLFASRGAGRGERVRIAYGMVAPCAVVAGFMAVQLIANLERWGNALTFAPWQYYYVNITYPWRMAILLRHGTFAILRVPYAIAYYAFGFNPLNVLPNFYAEYYGDIEGPRSVTLLCAPLVAVLAAGGAVALWRVRNRFNTSMLLLAGNCLSAIFTLGVPYMSLRYTFDIWGVLLILAALGLRAAAVRMPNPSREVRLGVIACLAVGIAGSHLTLLRYKINYSGTDPAVRYWLSARLQPLVCPGAKLAKNVRLSDFDPLVTPACPPLW